MCWTGIGFADDEGAFVEGTAEVGAHYRHFTDNPTRVGEYVNLNATKDLQADMYLDLFGGTENTLYNINLNYYDIATKSFDFGVNTKSIVAADFRYGSFVHNLDHDLMQNLQAKAGGKQIYNTDNDPMARYFMEYEEFHGDIKLDLPFMTNGQVVLGMRDQRRSGYKQTMTIDHCAFCHVESNAQRVDQQTRIWKADVAGSFGAVSLNYDFAKTDFVDHARTNVHRWKKAIHPVFGAESLDGATNYLAEFGSRQQFSDVTLPYARTADNDKISHHAGIKVDLQHAGTLKGSYTNTNRKNYWTGVEGKFDAGALGYAVRLSSKTRLTGKFLAYETKVDDVFVDLLPYREGRGAGGQDFDWTRISSANRKVYQGDLNLGWKVAKGRHLKVNWRYKIIDRPAMAQSQTNYIFGGVTNGSADIVETRPSTAFENKTTVNRIKLRYDARIGMKGNYNLTYTYTGVDKPYMNPTAMCEESVRGTNSMHNTDGPIGRLYYFQRERYGNGSNAPSQSHKATGRASYQVSPRTSFNAFLTYGQDKNDEMNIYQYDRDMLTPGLNLWTAPADNFLFTLGWTYYKVKSNANLCIPIFDG
jgi:hypothetical protein